MFSTKLPCLFVALAGITCLPTLHAAVNAATPAGTFVTRLENCFIRESSGVCASRQNPGLFWTHNDSGSGAFIFAFDTHGKDMGTFHLGAGSQDIEDIAAASIHGKNYLLVANTGVNGHGAPSFLYLMEEPEAGPATAKTMQSIPREKISVIPFHWPGGVPKNCEAVGLSPTGEVFLATKTYASLIYRLQLSWNANGSVTASPLKLIARYQFSTLRGAQTTPTGMDISPDGRSMAFIYDPYNDGQCVEFTLPAGGSWESTPISEWIKTQYGQVAPAGRLVQPEAICYDVTGMHLYVTSEGGANRATKPRGIGPDNNYPDAGPTPLWVITRRPVAAAPSAIAALTFDDLILGSWASAKP